MAKRLSFLNIGGRITYESHLWTNKETVLELISLSPKQEKKQKQRDYQARQTQLMKFLSALPCPKNFVDVNKQRQNFESFICPFWHAPNLPCVFNSLHHNEGVMHVGHFQVFYTFMVIHSRHCRRQLWLEYSFLECLDKQGNCLSFYGTAPSLNSLW